MSSELDDLQALVIADARKIYSETVLDHAMNPRNVGAMQDFDGFARITGPCGDTIEVWLKVNNNTITDIYFMTDGVVPVSPPAAWQPNWPNSATKVTLSDMMVKL